MAEPLLVTADCVVFRLGGPERAFQALLVERGIEPFRGRWAIPGGFVRPDEALDAAARRELFEETGVADAYLEQLCTIGTVDRDPRGRVVTVCHYALLQADAPVRGGSDARRAAWFDADAAPPLAFDHDAILRLAVARLRAKVKYAPVVFGLMPKEFTLAELAAAYGAIAGAPVELRHFRRKVEALAGVVVAGSRATGRRPAAVYRFDAAKQAKAAARGVPFHL